MSQAETGNKAEGIMDVNQHTLEQVMQAEGIFQMIHGHTHRPAIHNFKIDTQPATRIVLGDWYEQGSVLVCDEDGYELQGLKS